MNATSPDGTSAEEKGTTPSEQGLKPVPPTVSIPSTQGVSVDLATLALEGRLMVLNQQLNLVGLFRRAAEVSVPIAEATREFRTGAANGEALLHFALDDVRNSLATRRATRALTAE